MQQIINIFLILIFFIESSSAQEEIFSYKPKVRASPFQKSFKYSANEKFPSDFVDEILNSVEIVKLNHADAVESAESLAGIFPGVKINKDLRTNSLILNGTKKEIKLLKELIFKLDKEAPQILIESKVIEVASSQMSNLGINFKSAQEGVNFAYNVDSGRALPSADLVAALNLLISQGKANLISAPRIATLDGKAASINIGDKIPYSYPLYDSKGNLYWKTEYINSGVLLSITPRLGRNDEISMILKPEISSLKEWRNTAAGQFPVISTRQAEANIRAKSGETIVLAGLINDEEKENLYKLPFFGDMPLFGILFQNKSKEKAKTEILFLITPKVI